MTTKTVQEIYDDIASSTHAPTAREIIDVMIEDGYSIAEIKTELQIEYSKLKSNEKSTYIKNRNSRLPTQVAWDNLTDSERLSEWNAEGAYDFAISKANRIKNELNDIIKSFETEKGIAQDTFNENWKNKEDLGWVVE